MDVHPQDAPERVEKTNSPPNKNSFEIPPSLSLTLPHTFHHDNCWNIPRCIKEQNKNKTLSRDLGPIPAVYRATCCSGGWGEGEKISAIYFFATLRSKSPPTVCAVLTLEVRPQPFCTLLICEFRIIGRAERRIKTPPLTY